MKKSGFALPGALFIVFCLSIWIASVSWQMTNQRSRYQRAKKSRQAYFLARAGVDHFLLKIKTMQRQAFETIVLLEDHQFDENSRLFKIFTEDILVLPDDDFTAESYRYQIEEFRVETVDRQQGYITVRVSSSGNYGGVKHSINRLIRLSR